MGFFSWIVPRSLMSKLALVCFGFLLGSVLATVRMGQHIDRLVILREEQVERINSLEAELEQVRNSLSQRQQPTISSVTVNIEFADPKPNRAEEDSIRLSLEKQVKDLLKQFVGKKIDGLDPSLIPWVIENRLLEAESYTFQVQVKLLVLTDKVHLTVVAEMVSKHSF